MYYGKHIILRQLRLSDVDIIMEKWNTLELRMTLNDVLPHSREQEEEFIRQSWTKIQQKSGYTFAITTQQDEFLGTVGLFDIDQQNQSCELGIAIHQITQRGKGFGPDAIITLCGLAFLHLNMNRVQLEYLTTNARGARAYVKAGFTEVGTKRAAIYRNGKYVDLVQMDILRDEWMEQFSDEYTLLEQG